jgi:anaerobic magnesium-protoporphyrin IX monomethyl ester cyclase
VVLFSLRAEWHIVKICLTTLHCRGEFIPLALLYLKTYLVESQGHDARDIEILEYDQTSPADDIVRGILATEPDVLGLSIYVWNVTTLMAVARRVKALRPQITIVIGGPEVGPIAMSVLQAQPQIDVIIKSEGEVPFADVVNALTAAGDLSAVKGICRRVGEAIIEHEDAPIVTDLDVLPSPHLMRWSDFTGRYICVETQRGCVFRCNFCFYNKDFALRNRRFDLDRVKEEILHWLQQEIAGIYLMDPIFNLNAERAKEICRFIIAHNHRRVPFHAELWAEFVDDELARLLREANFTFLEIGLQSTDDTALATVERRLRLQRFIDGVEHMKRHELRFELQLIYGLPGETAATFRKSLNFAYSLGARDLEVFRLMILPGTDLRRKAQGLELEFDPEPPYYVRSHFSMTSAEIEYGTQIERAVEALRHSRTIRFLSREPGVTFADLVDAYIAWPGGDIRQFVSAFCDRHQIPVAFYSAFSSREFLPPSPTHAL